MFDDGTVAKTVVNAFTRPHWSVAVIVMVENYAEEHVRLPACILTSTSTLRARTDDLLFQLRGIARQTPFQAVSCHRRWRRRSHAAPMPTCGEGPNAWCAVMESFNTRRAA